MFGNKIERRLFCSAALRSSGERTRPAGCVARPRATLPWAIALADGHSDHIKIRLAFIFICVQQGRRTRHARARALPRNAEISYLLPAISFFPTITVSAAA